MPQLPETRETLLQRLPNPADVEAWDRFLEIYEPLLWRMARSHGLQPADADDLVQEVLVAVAGHVEKWVAQGARGRFRAWLFRIARNLLINFATRAKHVRWGHGGSGETDWFASVPDPSPEASRLIQNDYRRELFRWAAERVRTEVSDPQWLAFWKTSVELQPIPEVARAIGLSVGAVYIARSRIMKRIADTVRQQELEEGGES